MGSKKTGEENGERKREGRWGTVPRNPVLFYSLNIEPNQAPSALCAREYKCPPSRLYNHGSVKLTSQSCSQPQSPHTSHALNRRPPRLALSEFSAVSEFKCGGEGWAVAVLPPGKPSTRY